MQELPHLAVEWYALSEYTGTIPQLCWMIGTVEKNMNCPMQLAVKLYAMPTNIWTVPSDMICTVNKYMKSSAGLLFHVHSQQIREMTYVEVELCALHVIKYMSK